MLEGGEVHALAESGAGARQKHYPYQVITLQGVEGFTQLPQNLEKRRAVLPMLGIVSGLLSRARSLEKYRNKINQDAGQMVKVETKGRGAAAYT